MPQSRAGTACGKKHLHPPGCFWVAEPICGATAATPAVFSSLASRQFGQCALVDVDSSHLASPVVIGFKLESRLSARADKIDRTRHEAAVFGDIHRCPYIQWCALCYSCCLSFHMFSQFYRACMTNTTYTADAIEVLSGLDPVRKRPGMYTDTTRPNHLAQEVIDNSVDEALAGHARNIQVVLHEDQSLEVIDDGRGMPVDIHPEAGS